MTEVHLERLSQKYKSNKTNLNVFRFETEKAQVLPALSDTPEASRAAYGTPEIRHILLSGHGHDTFYPVSHRLPRCLQLFSAHQDSALASGQVSDLF